MALQAGKDQKRKRKMDIDLSKYSLFQEEKIQHVSLLPQQGYCNLNYLAKTEKNAYVARKLQVNKIDRAFEFKVQQYAAHKNLAAKAYLYDDKEHLILSDFLQGVHKEKLTPRELRTLAQTLGKLHGIKLRKRHQSLKKEFKAHHTKAHYALKKLQKKSYEPVVTHHDLNPKNILFHHHKIKFIDWEYSGINDRYFDLATISAEFKLTLKEERYFLQRYFQNHTKPNLKKLHLYKELYTILCSVWFKNLNNNN